MHDDVACLGITLLQIQASKLQESASHPTSLSASWKVSATSLKEEPSRELELRCNKTDKCNESIDSTETDAF